MKHYFLSNSGVSYGRAVVEIRICALPGRDSTEKEITTTQSNGKITEKRKEPTSATDVTTTTSNALSPRSSPTMLYPPWASVLMSASKDPSSAPEPFQTQTHKHTTRQQYICASADTKMKFDFVAFRQENNFELCYSCLLCHFERET